MYKLLLSTLVLFGLFSATHAEDNKTIVATPKKTAKEAPKTVSMHMTDIKGKTYKVTGTVDGLTIEGLENKVIFLEFFGHQCPPCLASIPHLINLQKKHQKELAIVAIEVQGYDTATLSKFAKEKGMDYIVVSEETASKLVTYIQQRAQWSGGIPFLVALDKTGNVQFIQAGMLPEESLEALFKDLSTLKKENNATKPVENNTSKKTTIKTSTTKTSTIKKSVAKKDTNESKTVQKVEVKKTESNVSTPTIKSH